MKYYYFSFVCCFLLGCGSGETSENSNDDVFDQGQVLSADPSADLYNEITVIGNDRFHYFIYTDGLIYDFGYIVGEGDVDDTNVDGFDPYTTTENQMIFDDKYSEFSEPYTLEGVILDNDQLFYPGGIYCVEMNTGEVPCTSYLDEDVEFSEGAVAYPYTTYYPDGSSGDSVFFNDIALNDIKRALLGN